MKLSLGMKFFVAIGVVISVSMGAIFYWTSQKQEEFILEQVQEQCRILFRQIVLTRQWVANHGGVFVEKLPGITTNPFLADAEIRDQRGKTYTKRNPALVTRELSEFAEKGGLYKFRVTSLKLMNPKNAPDNFERRALRGFEEEQLSEIAGIEKTSAGRIYRYAAPLKINASCLTCHGVQGYKEGDIKGAVSIMIPLHEADRAIRSNNLRLFLSGLGLIAAVILTLYLLMRKLVIQPVRDLKASAVRIGGGVEYPAADGTGDEIEELRSAFQEMDRRLQESRDHLEEKVRAATKNLADANLKLTEVDRLKSDFVSNVSHELRTPLTAISGAVDVLLRQQEGDGRTFLEIIKKNSERLIRMVMDLLDLSRIEAGKMEMQFSLTNLSFLTEEVVAFVAKMAEEQRIQVESRVPESLWVLVDEDRIKQVLINLLSNAIKFSPPGGRVRLYTEEDEAEVRFSVEDQGIGISFTDQEKIFSKFEQVRHAAAGKRAGVGLGLAISKGIVEAHGGTIRVQSSPGQGSTFIFSIPKREESHGP